MDDSELRSQLERHHADSYGWALACCSQNRELAEDILQTAYLKILQGCARYRGEAAFKTWLFAVIRVTAADERRRFWRRWFGLNNYGRDLEPAGTETPRDDASDETARLDAFRLALERLPQRQREVIHLICYQHLSLKEAAGVMGISLGSARTHYDRAKTNLRGRLAKLECFSDYGTDRGQIQRAL
ncbi:MAG: RNA polymerase sigma factor [Verrucomicrobiales bacterium]|nr:RNA polymerase sigma factor [Verrucomicrobiales bacterium]